MSRTRGASSRFSDGGELLGKGGVPLPVPDHVRLDRQGQAISPVVAHMQMQIKRLSGHTVLQGPGAEPVTPLAPITSHRCDRTTFSKNMQAYDLALLLDMVLKDMGGFSVEVSEAVFSTLPGDLRQHFTAVRKAPVDESPSIIPYDGEPPILR